MEEFKEESDRDAKNLLERKKGVKDTFFCFSPTLCPQHGLLAWQKTVCLQFFLATVESSPSKCEVVVVLLLFQILTLSLSFSTEKNVQGCAMRMLRGGEKSAESIPLY